jgi:uncharacterized protein YeaO (DUF488 family)
MAAVSKHPADVLVWLKKVLESCETHSQLNTCGKLFNLFEKQYSNTTDELYHPYTYEFRILCDSRWDKYSKISNQN